MARRRRAVAEMELSQGFWRGRRVLVTGHTGFKGSWLSLWLQELGAEAAGVALRAPPGPSLWDAARVGEGMRTIEADLRSLGALEAAFAEHRPEVVLHLAAQPIVSRSLRDPVGTFEVNVMGTVNVLEAARRTDGVRAVVNVTSDKAYEDAGTGQPHREGDRLGGRDPYSASKACSELVTAAYHDSFEGPAVASARAGNVIGGGDWGEDRLIPDLMRAALGGPRAEIRRPYAVRPWQHVLNPLSGYLLLAQQLCEGGAELAGAWNFAPDESEAWPVERVVERVRELWGEPIDAELGAGPGFEETHYLRLDSSKARDELGWDPGWGIEEGLRAVVDWHRGAAAGADARELTVGQIRAHPAAGRP
jgi:CDP-glucose 4,6-dehydratase